MIDNRVVQFKNWKCSISLDYYINGRLAITLLDIIDREPVATATVNAPHFYLEDDEVVIKSYSENEGMLDALEKAGVIKKTGRAVALGHTMGDVAIYISEEKAKKAIKYDCIAVIDRSMNGLFLYDVPQNFDGQETEDFLTSEGRNMSDCSWGVIDGKVEDLRDDNEKA